MLLRLHQGSCAETPTLASLIDDRRLCIEAMSASTIPPHVLTGCEHNTGFYGASKTVIADRLEKSKEAQHLLLLLAACGT